MLHDPPGAVCHSPQRDVLTVVNPSWIRRSTFLSWWYYCLLGQSLNFMKAAFLQLMFLCEPLPLHTGTE
jgi:hypothetical protein